MEKTIVNMIDKLYQKREYISVINIYNKYSRFENFPHNLKIKSIITTTYCLNEIRCHNDSVTILENLYSQTKDQKILLEMLKLYVAMEKFTEYFDLIKNIKVTQQNTKTIDVMNLIVNIRTNNYKELAKVKNPFNIVYDQWKTMALQGLFLLDRLALPITNEQLLKLAERDCHEYLVDTKIEQIKFDPSVKQINVGFLSPDFFDRPSGYLMSHLFKYFSKKKFKTFLISRLTQPKSHIGTYLREFCDVTIELGPAGAQECAKIIKDNNIHILIDIMGLMYNNNVPILSLRPANVQIAWLAYPGTMGIDHVDYLVADRHLVPKSEQKYYKEKIIYMPECYQINDDMVYHDIDDIKKYQELDKINAPKDWGSKVLLGNMNYNYKIDSFSWEMWKEIIKKTDNTILVILKPTKNDHCEKNLKQDWIDSNLDLDRIFFWEPIILRDHHMRIKKYLSVGLDPYHCNSHTTGTDILINGVPLVTFPSNTFAGSVAKSLLHSIQMDELVVNSRDEYINLVIELTKDPKKLLDIKNKLNYNIRKYNTFNTKRYVQHFESSLDLVVKNMKKNVVEHIYTPSINEYKKYSIENAKIISIKNTDNNIKLEFFDTNNDDNKLDVLISNTASHIWINKTYINCRIPKLSDITIQMVGDKLLNINNIINVNSVLGNAYNFVNSNVEVIVLEKTVTTAKVELIE